MPHSTTSTTKLPLQKHGDGHPANGLARVAFGVEYDGSALMGWQHQQGLPTVQGALFEAFVRYIGEPALQVLNLELAHFQRQFPSMREHFPPFNPLSLAVAGRTDKGVHAHQQVFHVDFSIDLATQRKAFSWLQGVNRYLPPQIRLLWMRVIHPDLALVLSSKSLPPAPETFTTLFDSRRSATARHYRYVLLTRRQPSALYHGKVGWVWRSLDVSAMQKAAQVLVGTHDFTSFRSSECQAKTPIRTIMAINIHEQSQSGFFETQASITHTLTSNPFSLEQPPQWLVIDLYANAFLHHMVRNIVGALVEVGAGLKSVAWMQALLMCKDRTQGAATFMPDGLYLWQVDYPANFSKPTSAFADNRADINKAKPL